MKRRCIASLAMIISVMSFGATPVFAKAPVLRQNAEDFIPAENAFASAIIVDSASGKVLYQYQPTKKWPAASLTKLANALVLLDHAPQWSKSITMSSKDLIGGGQLGASVGSRISVTDLFYSALVLSANDAAVALARSSRIGTEAFVKEMNAKAKDLGLASTTFVDPSGLDPENVTTAADMAKIAAKAFANPTIRRTTTTGSYRVAISTKDTKGKSILVHKTIKNTNHLLTRDDDIYVLGGKTGFLYESMYNIAVRIQPIHRDRPPLIVVVMGSPTYSGSFAQAKGLANWAWKAYSWPSP